MEGKEEGGRTTEKSFEEGGKNQKDGLERGDWVLKGWTTQIKHIYKREEGKNFVAVSVSSKQVRKEKVDEFLRSDDSV